MLLKESFLSTEHTDSLAILAAAYLERKPERVKREREREREGGGGGGGRERDGFTQNYRTYSLLSILDVGRDGR